MKISFTKTMCVLLALFAVSAGSMALTLVGKDWAKPVGIACMSLSVWVGFPASVLAMLRKIHDDRGRLGTYSYFDDDAHRNNDKYYVVYPACVALLLLAVSLCGAGYVEGFFQSEGVNNAFAMSDRGRSIDRQDIAKLLIFCIGLCTMSATFMAYVLREKGLYLAKLSLACASLCLILILTIYTREVSA